MILWIGSIDRGVVEVTNCFCVPHKEHDDQVEAELGYALDVYELNRRANSNESIVGKSSVFEQKFDGKIEIFFDPCVIELSANSSG